MRTERRATRRAAASPAARALALGAAFIVCVSSAHTVAAQMRPLDPIEWEAFSAPGGRASLGLAVLSGQRAALLGSKGRLLDLGMVSAAFRVDRVVITVLGSARRAFDQQERYSEPAEGVRPGDDDRSDAGTVTIATTVALGVPAGGDPGTASWAARFGVRLPTTDDREGLERDETDVFASVGGRHRTDAWELAGELGASIFGVHGNRFAQTDPYQYAAAVRMLGRRARPYAHVTGHVDTRTHGPPRGNDNLSEVRVGAEIGGRRWIDAAAILGLSRHSPAWGVRVRAGIVW